MARARPNCTGASPRTGEFNPPTEACSLRPIRRNRWLFLEECSRLERMGSAGAPAIFLLRALLGRDPSPARQGIRC